MFAAELFPTQVDPMHQQYAQKSEKEIPDKKVLVTELINEPPPEGIGCHQQHGLDHGVGAGKLPELTFRKEADGQRQPRIVLYNIDYRDQHGRNEK